MEARKRRGRVNKNPKHSIPSARRLRRQLTSFKDLLNPAITREAKPRSLASLTSCDRFRRRTTPPSHRPSKSSPFTVGNRAVTGLDTGGSQ